MTQVLLLGEIGNPDGDWTTESTDDGSGAGAAPDEGLLDGGFIARVSNAYELTWAGSGAVRKWYLTNFAADNFELSADVQRGPSQANHGWPGIAFLLKDASNMMMITLTRVDDDLVDILFRRYDGADQDEVILESDVSLAYEAWIKLGVRVQDQVITGFRANPGAGDIDGEISLGTITETSSPSWIGDSNHRLMGVVQHQATTAQGVAWDNIRIRTVGVGFGQGSELYYLAEDSFGAQSNVGDDAPMVEETQNYLPLGRIGEVDLRKILVPIAYEGSCTIRVTPIVDFDVELRPKVFSLPVPSKRRRVALEVTAAKRCTFVRVRIEVVLRTGRVEFFTPEFAFTPKTEVAHTVAGVD